MPDALSAAEAPGDLSQLGSSLAAIAHHYDLSDDFFALWLGPELVYSCAWWSDDPDETLAVAQGRKLDTFAGWLGVRGGHVLDVGCGWGGLLRRFAGAHGMRGGVGLTRSGAQLDHAAAIAPPGVEHRLEHWADHRPDRRYDAITCIEATEHFARDGLASDIKVAVYRELFERCYAWLRDGGRLGLQLICLDQLSNADAHDDGGPMARLIRTEIFPEAVPASLAEMVLGWETWFRLERFEVHPRQYVRTFRAWAGALRARRAQAVRLVGPDKVRTIERYFATGEAVFRTGAHTLYRVALVRRPQPKVWSSLPRPWPVAAEAAAVETPADAQHGGSSSVSPGASTAAVQAHYDVSDAFYALWLGPTMVYTSGWWHAPTARDAPAASARPAIPIAAAGPATPAADDDLEDAVIRKIDRFAAEVLPEGRVATVLDVGCGWGYPLRRLIEAHGVAGGVGLTLSAAQAAHVAAAPIPGVDVRVQSWIDHEPAGRYDAIISFGAFEHFARDGDPGPARVAAYRRFFARCFDWLMEGGRLGLETIAHDDAPETDHAGGRGPLGDSVLALYPESICPQLSELALAFEPWFSVRLLRSDAADFARTCRLWHARLRGAEAAAVALVGRPTYRAFRSYLAASEAQFRLGAITNYRLVLERRPQPRR